MSAEPARRLVVVDADSGEQLAEGCPGCNNADIVIKKLNARINGLDLQIENERRDRAAEARQHGLWPLAIDLFGLWRIASVHPKAQFNHERFDLILPFLEGHRRGDGVSVEEGPPTNAIERCAAAIIGRCADHYTSKRKNGTLVRYNEWERIFGAKGQGATARSNFEESAARRPPDWRTQALELVPDLAPAADELKLAT